MGFEILTSIQELIPKGPNEYFFYEVLGCSVIDESGINIGIVVDILETGAHNVIVIREDSGQEDAQEILIPFVQAYIIQADYVNRIIHMRVPRYQS
jgi:16S rRNA processing protein RimM